MKGSTRFGVVGTCASGLLTLIILAAATGATGCGESTPETMRPLPAEQTFNLTHGKLPFQFELPVGGRVTIRLGVGPALTFIGRWG